MEGKGGGGVQKEGKLGGNNMRKFSHFMEKEPQVSCLVTL